MLFELSDELLSPWPTDPSWLHALTNLGCAAHEGKHVVTGSFPVLQKILQSTTKDERTRGFFQNIKQQLQQSQQLLARLPERAQVHHQPGPVLTRQRSGAALIYRVHYGYLADSMRTQATALVAEDFNDSTLYRVATQAYTLRHPEPDLRATQLALREVLGGGRRVADVYLSQAQEAPTLCVVDSDRRSATGPLGETARHLAETAAQGEGPLLCAHHILPCQEVENLLPAPLLRRAVANVADGSEGQCRVEPRRIDGLAALGLLASGPPWWYLDLKADHLLRTVLTTQDAAQRDLLLMVFERVRSRSASPSDGWCQEQPRCQSKEQCRCQLLRGLTRHCGGLVANHMKTAPLDQIAEDLFSEQAEEVRAAWRALCEKVLAWGCALRRHSA